jgi:serine/threonine protein kinase
VIGPDKTQHYTLLRLIARGGSSEVRLGRAASQVGSPKLVAIKRLLPGLADPDLHLALLAREDQLGRAVSHPGIVSVLDSGLLQGLPFLALEFVDGPDLRRLMARCHRRGVLPPVEVALHLAHRLTTALGQLHSLDLDQGGTGWVHCDISPGNVLFDRSGAIKVCDLSLAVPIGTTCANPRRTPFGTAPYMSPEQTAGLPLDHRSDLFSMAVVLYEFLSGRYPDSALGGIQTGADVEPTTDIRRYRPDVPSGLAGLLQVCLAPKPEDRFDNAIQVREALIEQIIQHPGAEEAETVARFLSDLVPAPRRTYDDVLRGTGVPSWVRITHQLTGEALRSRGRRTAASSGQQAASEARSWAGGAHPQRPSPTPSAPEAPAAVLRIPGPVKDAEAASLKASDQQRGADPLLASMGAQTPVTDDGIPVLNEWEIAGPVSSPPAPVRPIQEEEGRTLDAGRDALPRRAAQGTRPLRLTASNLEDDWFDDSEPEATEQPAAWRGWAWATAAVLVPLILLIAGQRIAEGHRADVEPSPSAISP